MVSPVVVDSGFLSDSSSDLLSVAGGESEGWRMAVKLGCSSSQEDVIASVHDLASLCDNSCRSDQPELFFREFLSDGQLSLEKFLDNAEKIVSSCEKCGQPVAVAMKNCCSTYFPVFHRCQKYYSCENCRSTQFSNVLERVQQLGLYARDKRCQLVFMTATLKERNAVALDKWQRIFSKFLDSRLPRDVLSFVEENLPSSMAAEGKNRQKKIARALDKYLEKWRKQHPGKYPKLRDVIPAGVRMLEVSGTEKSMHVHAHCVLALPTGIPQILLSALWESTTGASRVVDIRKVKNLEGAIFYVAKYLKKEQRGRGRVDGIAGLCVSAYLFHRPLVQSFGTDFVPLLDFDGNVKRTARGRERRQLTFLTYEPEEVLCTCKFCGGSDFGSVFVGAVCFFDSVNNIFTTEQFDGEGTVCVEVAWEILDDGSCVPLEDSLYSS